MFQRHRYLETEGWKNLDDPVASKKYDGAHFYLRFDSNGKPSFISRRQSVKGDYPDRTSKLPHLSDINIPELSSNTYSVELIHTGWDPTKEESHAAVSGILNSLPERAISTQKVTGPIRAVLLDVIHPKLETYKDKLKHLKIVEEKFNKPSFVFMPEISKGKENIDKLINKTKERGGEGVIVTSLTKPEHENPRFKIKHYGTYNLKVKGITQEYDIHGKPKNSAGALVLEDASGKEVCQVGTGLTREMRLDIWNNPSKWIGKLIQVKAMPSTARRLRHPVYNGFADGDIDLV